MDALYYQCVISDYAFHFISFFFFIRDIELSFPGYLSLYFLKTNKFHKPEFTNLLPLSLPLPCAPHSRIVLYLYFFMKLRLFTPYLDGPFSILDSLIYISIPGYLSTIDPFGWTSLSLDSLLYQFGCTSLSVITWKLSHS